MKGLPITLATRIAVLIAVALVAGAAFLARGIEPGITFATSGIDLKIDSKGWYNGKKIDSATWKLKDLNPGSDKFFEFDDIKPGDYGCEVVSLHVKKADAWMCMDFKNFETAENGVNEPESHVNGGPDDLANGTEFFGWMDDGDGKYEPPLEKPMFGTSTQAASYVLNNTTYAIADYRGKNFCSADSKRFVAMCWCAGNLTVLPNGKFECDATALGNEAQTDSFSVDVEFRAVPEKQNKKFTCGGYAPVPPPCDKCSGNINVTVTNNNFADITNTTSSSANTGSNSSPQAGGNSAGGGGTTPSAGSGQATTGDASSETTTTIITNTNSTNTGGGSDASEILNRLLDRFRR